MHSIQLNLGPLSGMVHCTMSLKERHPARITVVIQAREPGADVRHECSHHHNDCRQHVDVGGRLGALVLRKVRFLLRKRQVLLPSSALERIYE